MKKLILSLIFTTLAFSSFAMTATVVSTKGKAESQQNGNSWTPLKVGDTLDQGTVIQTGFKSELVLKIKESTITVSPLSRLTLQTLAEREGLAGAAAKDETAIFLDTGALKTNVQKSADRRVGFTVRSPVATASVRGTEFKFATRFKAVALSAKNGRVAFWKNTRQSEAALNEAAANPETPAEEATEGNEPGDISEYAAVAAIVVSEGENASASENSGMTAPSQMALSNSSSIGSGTQTAADTEKPATTFAPTPAPSTGGSSSGQKGSLAVTVSISD